MGGINGSSEDVAEGDAVGGLIGGTEGDGEVVVRGIWVGVEVDYIGVLDNRNACAWGEVDDVCGGVLTSVCVGVCVGDGVVACC